MDRIGREPENITNTWGRWLNRTNNCMARKLVRETSKTGRYLITQITGRASEADWLNRLYWWQLIGRISHWLFSSTNRIPNLLDKLLSVTWQTNTPRYSAQVPGNVLLFSAIFSSFIPRASSYISRCYTWYHSTPLHLKNKTNKLQFLFPTCFSLWGCNAIRFREEKLASCILVCSQTWDAVWKHYELSIA